MKNKILFLILFLVAFSERVAFDLGSNYELVTATMVIAAMYLGRKNTAILVFLTLFLSDLIIGNSGIFVFTWSGFLIPALIIEPFLKKNNMFHKILSGTIAGAAGVGFFFLWTNFGVWLTTSMYSKNIAGLVHSYINALPFLRNQAVSALIFIPSGILLTQSSFNIADHLQQIHKDTKILLGRRTIS